MKLLVMVDDDEQNIRALKRLVRTIGGIDFQSYLSTQDAQEALEGGEVVPQVCICDESMAGMTGTQFLQRVKERLPDTTTVLLTGKHEYLNHITTHRAHFDYLDVLWPKPFSFDELRALLQNR